MCTFKIGDPVVRIVGPGGVGTICGLPRRFNGENHYPIRFGGQVINVAEDNIKIFDGDASLESLIRGGAYSGPGQLSYELTLSRLGREFKDTLYSYAASRTELYPFQYKPLLKFLNSPRKRLLIADEVGLGKTIEAGYILQEERARKHVSRTLIVCPSSLRYKWQREMADRFGIHFDILDSKAARGRIPSNSEQWNVPGDFYGIVSLQTLSREKTLNVVLESDPNLDVLIVDEVHRCKNPAANQSKAVQRIAEYSDAVLFLTATPIQTGDQNMFVLLNMLLPEEYKELYRFRDQLDANQHVVLAETELRKGTQASVENAKKQLENLSRTSIGIQLAQNPFFDLVMEQLNHPDATSPDHLVKAIEDLEQLNMFSHVLTRTRKREVDLKRPERRARTYKATPTNYESLIYNQLSDFVYDAYKREHGSQIAKFIVVNMYKHIASSLPATIARFRRKFEEDDWECGDADLSEYDVYEELGEESYSVLRTEAFHNIIDSVDLQRLQNEDTKYKELKKVLGQKRKTIVFSFYLDTLRYLEEKLNESNIKCVRIDGSVPSTPDEPETDLRRHRIEQFRDDSETMVMLSSQVGSEGLDFQFCDTVVNWDIPWNPMVVEQRIGRIDRIGQKSDRLLIFNLVTAETVEECILDRLYERLGIFEHSIGTLEPILGEIVHKLEQELLSERLTLEEQKRRISAAQQVIEQQKIDQERLETESEGLIGHDRIFEEQMERVRKLGRFISPVELEGFVEMALPKVVEEAYMEEAVTTEDNIRIRNLPYFRSIESKLILHNGRLDQDTQRFIRLMTTGIDLAFGGENLGNCPQGIEVLHAAHPLVRMLLAGISQEDILGERTLTAANVPCPALKPSIYFFTWGILNESGPFQGKSIVGAMYDVSGDESKLVDDPDAAEIMLHTLMLKGSEWHDFEKPPPEIVSKLFKEAENQLYKTRGLKQKRQQDRADAMITRRIAAIKASCEHKIQNREERLERASDQRIIRMLKGDIRNTKADFEAKLEEHESQRHITMDLVINGAGFVNIVEPEVAI